MRRRRFSQVGCLDVPAIVGGRADELQGLSALGGDVGIKRCGGAGVNGWAGADVEREAWAAKPGRAPIIPAMAEFEGVACLEAQGAL